MKIVKQLAGSIKALWHKSPALWIWDLYPRASPSGRHTTALGYKSHTTRNYGTTITLLSTPFNAHPNPQSPQTNPTIHNTQVHTTIPKQRIGNYGVCGRKDRCRDGNLRTYCHVSPILFGCFFCGSLSKYMYMYSPALSSSICLPIKMLRNAITKDKGMYGSF